MGEDLLTPSPILAHSKSLSLVDDPDELFRNAQIFFTEGLTEDAKKNLRKTLLLVPTHSLAQKFLEEIHAKELELLLSEQVESSAKTSQRESQHLFEGIKEIALDTEWVQTKALEQENREELEGFFLQLEGSPKASGEGQDWLDLGIAFSVMDLPLLAERSFRKAKRLLRLALDAAPLGPSLNFCGASCALLDLSATVLLAWLFFSEGRLREALCEIEGELRDSERPWSEKIELFYLAARIYEQMNDQELASLFFKEVMLIDKNYRDLQDRF